MRKFKGFWVPRADPVRVGYNKRRYLTLPDFFCFRSQVEDCSD